MRAMSTKSRTRSGSRIFQLAHFSRSLKIIEMKNIYNFKNSWANSNFFHWLITFFILMWNQKSPNYFAKFNTFYYNYLSYSTHQRNEYFPLSFQPVACEMYIYLKHIYNLKIIVLVSLIVILQEIHLAHFCP